ncbi:hypothetical protein [Streptacidiphilus jiangxiensis]|nr:hypothetical protein [Streptacidiphilus jiangxiensis]
MKFFTKMRRSAAVAALAGLSVAGVIGFVHVVQPDPDYVGGLAPVHQTDPNYTGGHAPGMVTVAYGIPDPTYVGG